jgi:zinc protease
MKGQLENMKTVPNAYFADTLSKVEYANNPWANGLETPEDYNKLNPDRSFEIYKEVFGNAYGLHFTMVGNIDVEKIKPLLELYIGSLPSKPKENKYTDVGLRPIKGVVDFAVKKGAAKQSFVNLIFTGEANYSKEEELKLSMLTEVLNIRVIEKLREEMSGIYGGGFGSNLSRRPYGSYVLSARIPCGPENVDKLSKALLDIIGDARDKGISQTDLDKVKITLKKQNEDAMKENDHWLSSLSYAFIEKYDPAWLMYFENKVQSVTTNDLQETAKKYFNMKNYIKAVLNPEN